ncbi:MAG: hypothetical protein K9G33_10610 [Sneathiella sp.]|nr:hypothetical protein [Sneathiella sp.]
MLTDEDGLVHREISFIHAGSTLQGVLTLPTGVDKPASCVVFVHGSGDMPRDAYGYYGPIWRLLPEKVGARFHGTNRVSVAPKGIGGHNL